MGQCAYQQQMIVRDNDDITKIVFRRSFLQKDGEITLRFVSIALVYGKVIPNAEHQKQLEDFFGKPLDLNIVNDIITDEAKVLGIPAQQHFQFCLLKDDMVKQKKQIEEGMEEFMQQVGTMRFTTVESVMDELTAKAPKAHAAFILIFKETIGLLGKEAAVFAVNLTDALLNMLFNHVTMSPRSCLPMYGKAFKKIFAEYDSLSASAKVDFEKNTCYRTSMRKSIHAMRFLLFILASIALASSKSIPNSEHQKYLEIFFGLPLDMKIVNGIVAEEAKELGIPAQQHFQYCLLEDDGSMVKRMNEFEEGVEQFQAELKEALLKMLYNHVTMSARRRAPMYGKALKKIFAEFDALSANAKADFEKNTCFRTIMRKKESTAK
ncbi:hypothetical protein PRIPAC_73612 [Pristionchus pacificus]|uniref:Fatty-acid and retinol-binding protein 1 n=1 Tax=Pristionchus pacificus TaxID=54126 RepID=A0A2A6BDI1_PRIPA|nr:hypothetical protein PRIPAC_73612 [Pristionchus pacificus]|eukprot:PDM63934.1 hypothetical protein PRIPAC_53908 [Pristionchus pacificus]